jgi:hypothetical protein
VAGLAAAIGRSTNTMANTLGKRSPPSVPIAALLRGFVAGRGGRAGRENGAAGLAGPPAAILGPANGQPSAPLAAEALKALKRKRHALPLTTPTLDYFPAQNSGLELTRDRWEATQ